MKNNIYENYTLKNRNEEYVLIVEESNTAENVENAMAAFNSRISKRLAATVFQIPRYTLVNEYLGKHTKSESRMTKTIHTHKEERLISKTVEVLSDRNFFLTKYDAKMIFKKP